MSDAVTHPLERAINYEVIVGSTAYGLAHAGSDIDRLAVAVLPTEDVLGLRKPDETHVRHDTFDRQTHEVEKFCRLSLGCNPTLLEALYVDEKFILFMSDIGLELRNIRDWFPSTQRVVDAYGGYAYSQLKRLENREWARREKHARHVYRLMLQGLELLKTGTLTVTLNDAEADRCRWFSKLDNSRMRDEFELLRDAMSIRAGHSQLSHLPNTYGVNKWLIDVRRRNL